MAVKFYIQLQKPQPIEMPPNGLHLENKGGPTLFLIHGLTGTPNEMKFLAHYFNKRGYRVICPRLAHHGQPLGILKKAKWTEFYDSVRESLFKLNGQLSEGPVFVAGLSMGALLALLLAEEFPDKISGVSCLSPTLFYDGWNVPWSRHLLPLAYFTPLKHVFYFKEESPYGIKSEALRRLVHEYYQNADFHDVGRAAEYGYPYFPMTLFCELRLLIKHLQKRLPNIKVPVQLIQAKDDDMTSVKNSQYIYDRVSSDLKDLVLLENSYHVITADQERQTVATNMESFFNRAAVLSPS